MSSQVSELWSAIASKRGQMGCSTNRTAQRSPRVSAGREVDGGLGGHCPGLSGWGTAQVSGGVFSPTPPSVHPPRMWQQPQSPWDLHMSAGAPSTLV